MKFGLGSIRGDKPGDKIGTTRGVPSDLLTREIKAAEIVRIALSPTIADDAAGTNVTLITVRPGRNRQDRPMKIGER